MLMEGGKKKTKTYLPDGDFSCSILHLEKERNDNIDLNIKTFLS